jgi:hypothetical protein
MAPASARIDVDCHSMTPADTTAIRDKSSIPRMAGRSARAIATTATAQDQPV